MAISNAVDFIDFTNSSEWETWLAEHSDRQGEAWLRIAKKGSEIPSITIQEALDSALCYGWIDSHRRSFDARYYLQRYSPRSSKSPWSLVNLKKAQQLIETGKMKERGYAEIRLAQSDGRWDAAYESQKTAAIPPDLAAALEEHTQAKQAFHRLDKTAQYAAFLPILKTATAEVRSSQLRKAIAKLVMTR
ncbi:OmdA domain containing protein [Paenibacillus sp. LMG 31461]|uniref:OmdA domain containing protein n=1 Tax=Paenibacillus plantarum TaxID=2654975 RepID=A0ABX1XH55_9BACL|nr:YdeI/OmpD-associated family protein [Paenibacillus plantarum]NOU67803.1 OmdA domain containing protein [Paenibacillus plantarum]